MDKESAQGTWVNGRLHRSARGWHRVSLLAIGGGHYSNTQHCFKIHNSLPLPQEISDLEASRSSFSDLLLEGLCPNLRKKNTFAKRQSRCPQRSLRNKHPKGVDVTKHAPLLTCHYFTAKCLLAKYTRALSQSATVCTGIGATVTVSVQLKKSGSWVEGGSELPRREGPTTNTTCFRGQTPLCTSCWGFWSQISLGRKGWGRKTKVLSLYYSLNKTNWSGHQNLIQKMYFFLINKNKVINWEHNSQKSYFPVLSDISDTSHRYWTKLIRFGESSPPHYPSFLPLRLPQLLLGH